MAFRRSGGNGAQPRGNGALLAAGGVLVALGAAVLLYFAYQLYGTGLYAGKQQQSLAEALEKEWAEPAPSSAPSAQPSAQPVAPPAAPAPPAARPEAPPARSLPSRGDDPVIRDGSVPGGQQAGTGRAVAVLTAPSLGSRWRKVAVEGVRARDLRKGPGHYPGTAQPGEIGNSVFSGHRTTYGAPFGRIGELSPGDELVVETRTAVHRYEVFKSQIVRPSRISVAWPVPGDRYAQPKEALLTLITCHPRYSARQRLVVVARLVSSQDKPAG